MEKHRYSPFVGPVVACGLTQEHPSIWEIQGTEYFARTYQLGNDPKTRTQLLDYYKHVIKRWKKLDAYSGIELPKFSSVIGADTSNEATLFIVTEKIHGLNLDDFSVSTQEAPVVKEVFDSFMTGLVVYSKDIFYSRGDYLSDQNLSQYVYDDASSEKPRVVFVDLGTESHVLPETRAQHYENSYFFAQYVRSLFMMTEELEEKCDGFLFNTRLNLGEFIMSLPEGIGGISYARDILKSVMQPLFP